MLKQVTTGQECSELQNDADLELALNNISDSVLIKDTANNILFANQAACKFLDKASHDLINQACTEIYCEADAKKFYKDDLKIIESKKPICKIIESIETKDGQRVVTITDKIPMLGVNGEVERILVIKKSLEKQNIEVKQLAEKLKESSRKFDELRYLFSHDLLEPIRMISSFIELIEPILKSYKIKNEKLTKYFNFVRESSSKLKKIVSRTRKSLKG